MNSLWMLAQSLMNGVMMGGVYALIAVGLTIIFGVMKVVNFAQGEYLVIGMYVTLFLSQITGLEPYYLLAPVIFIAYMIGHLSFRVVVRPLLGQSGSNFIVATMGLSFVIQSILQLIFTANYLSVQTKFKAFSVSFGGISLSLPKVIAFLAMLVFVVFIYFLLKKTDLGRSMRATSENTAVAQSLGINTTKIYGFSFALGTTFAAITGLFLTPIYMIYPTVGSTFKSIAMVVIVMGGMGNIGGAVASGLLCGIVEALVATYVSNDLSPAAAYLLLILILVFKPQGLFGKGARTA